MRIGCFRQLLREYNVWVPALDFGEKESEAGSCDTAAEEDYIAKEDEFIAGWVMIRLHLLHRTAGVPMDSLSWLKASAEMIAPALPAAADMPWAAALYFVGNTSAG